MKPWLKVVLVLAAVALFVGGLLFYESNREAAMTAEAEATVTKVTFIKDQESSSLDETEIRYTFDSKGSAIQSSDTIPGDHVEEYNLGQKIRICYNPGEPSASNISNDKCGG